jgi:aminoglycoside N3'-acetyltransferase
VRSRGVTSGSTGLPKGVAIEHRSVVNFLASMRREPGLRAGDRLLAVTTLSFDIAGLELYLPLAVGACVEVVSREVAADPARLRERLAHSGATVMQATPASWRMLVEAGWERAPALKVLCGGEALGRELANALLARACEVWNLYGPTETTIWSAAYKLDGKQGAGSAVPLGRPIANTQLYVLDEAMQPVPAGVAGELYIGGAGLARGYLNRPELTAEKFVPDPFGPVPGGRLYRTGDLARYRPDGTLEYLGRIDHQVKVRGYRIELGEVEAVLRKQAGVREAVVVAREAMPGDQRLVAYVVPAQGPGPAVSELRDFVKAQLPDYMVPSAFVLLDALPLTPNGKVDRRALPAPDYARPELEKGLVAPHDAFERQLTHMWEDLLGVTPIGVQDDFFALGGHSLLAVQLFAHVEKWTGQHLPLAILFQNPTIAQLASSLRQEGVVAPGALPVGIHHERSAADRIRYPIAQYIPSRCHAYLRNQYHRIKQLRTYLYLRAKYIKGKKNFTKRFSSYTPMQLENMLKTMGIRTGDTVLMHSAFHVFNGFAGTPDQVITCVLNIIGASGNLVMVSMPYTGSTAAYLRAGVPFDVRHTSSAMGVITEIFRQTPGVVRSVNPAHPILAWGPAAPWIIADHENTMYSCGKGSPFEKLVHLQAKTLLFDVSLRSLTFFHYVKDLFQSTLPVQLYEEMPVESIIIDTSRNKKAVKTYVFSSESRRCRSQNLQEALIKEEVLKTATIGNTKLIVLQLQQVIECAQHMVRAGKPLWKI